MITLRNTTPDIRSPDRAAYCFNFTARADRSNVYTVRSRLIDDEKQKTRTLTVRNRSNREPIRAVRTYSVRAERRHSVFSFDIPISERYLAERRINMFKRPRFRPGRGGERNVRITGPARTAYFENTFRIFFLRSRSRLRRRPDLPRYVDGIRDNRNRARWFSTKLSRTWQRIYAYEPTAINRILYPVIYDSAWRWGGEGREL